MNVRLRHICLFALWSLLLLAGCEKREVLSFASEESEPYFERGKQFIRQGRNQEALSSFLKVIAKRGDDAPESHLEAALIYRSHIKDPLAAIYHFRKYLELQPNSRQADLVRQHIDACKREFARTLPANPLEDASVKIGFMEQLDQLQRENDQLKAEITALRAGLPAGSTSAAYGSPSATRRSGFEIPISQSQPPQQMVPMQPQPAEELVSSGRNLPASEAPVITPNRGPQEVTVSSPPPASTPAATVATPRSKPTPPSGAQNVPAAQASGKRHTVQAGDTLYSISTRYYGTGSRWRDIYQANRDQLKGENDKLRRGMELKIP